MQLILTVIAPFALIRSSDALFFGGGCSCFPPPLICCCTPTPNCQPCGSSGEYAQPQYSNYASPQYLVPSNYNVPKVNYSTNYGQYQPPNYHYSQPIVPSYEGGHSGGYSQTAPASYPGGRQGSSFEATPPFRGQKKFQGTSEASQLVEQANMPKSVAAPSEHHNDDGKFKEAPVRRPLADLHELADAPIEPKTSSRIEDIESEEAFASKPPSVPKAHKYPYQEERNADAEAEVAKREKSMERREEKTHSKPPEVITLKHYRRKHLRYSNS